MGLYCSKQLETTVNQVGKKSLHIIFKVIWGEHLSVVMLTSLFSVSLLLLHYFYDLQACLAGCGNG